MTTIHKRAMLVGTLITVACVILPLSVHARLKFVDFYDAAWVTEGLDSPDAVAMSPDGKYVYVGGRGADNNIVIFRRNSSTGELTYRGFVEKWDMGFTSLAVSPDGDHIYGASCDDDALLVFRRDPITGGLTYVEVQQDGVGGVDGLSWAESVTVSPDGAHVYAAGYWDNAVAIFSRGAATGALTYVGREKNWVGGVVGLGNPNSVTVSPDGNHVYVTAHFTDSVVIFSRDAATGALTYVGREKDGVGGVDGIYLPNVVTVSPDGNHVYVGSENAVAVFSRDSITGALSYVEAHKDGVGGVDGLLHAEAVTVSPDGDHVYVAGTEDNDIAIFSRNSTTGALTYLGKVVLCFPHAVALSPDGKDIYVVNSPCDSVSIYSRNLATGELTYVGMQEDGVTSEELLNGATSVTVSPGGDSVYVACNVDDAVVRFDRNPASGALTYREVKIDGVGGVNGLNGSRSVTMSPDGAHVYVASFYDDAVAVFSTSPFNYLQMQQDGVNYVDGLDGAISVTVSPDGNHVYVAGYLDDAVAVFSRDSATGELEYVHMRKDGLKADGLNGATSVAVSPDGNHVYVAGYFDDAVAVFSREAATGALIYVGIQQDGVEGVDGLDGAFSVAVSPDGRHVYVAGSVDDAVAMFSRDSETGELTYLGIQQDGVGGVNGLFRAHFVTVSPDGNHVLAASFTEDTVVVFSRDSITGALTYRETHRDGEGGVDGLDGAYSVAVSPDSRHVYVPGYVDKAVALFARTIPIAPITPLLLLDD